MLEPVGDRVLGLIGKSPASKGIISVEEMPAAVRALEAAVQTQPHAQAEVDPHTDSEEPNAAADNVSLRQRIWPMVEMIKRSLEAGEPIVWGV